MAIFFFSPSVGVVNGFSSNTALTLQQTTQQRIAKVLSLTLQQEQECQSRKQLINYHPLLFDPFPGKGKKTSVRSIFNRLHKTITKGEKRPSLLMHEKRSMFSTAIMKIPGKTGSSKSVNNRNIVFSWQQKLKRRIGRKKRNTYFLLVFCSMMMITTMFCFPQDAFAAMATTTTQITSSSTGGESSMLFHRLSRKLNQFMTRKVIKRLGIVILSGLYTIRLRKQQRRQAIDATSEWGRYCKHPATRGRALGSLFMLQVFPMWCCTQVLKVLSLFGGKRSSENNKANDDVMESRTTLNGDDDDSSLNMDKKKIEDNNKKKNSPLHVQMSYKTGQVLADGLLRIGPLYIKLGQIISCRDNLLPQEWIQALTKLQDQVPAKSGSEALELVYSAMDGGKEEFDATFEYFDTTPIAAASLGQVHKAVLKKDPTNNNSTNNNNNNNNNNFVAVKVQRAMLREIYNTDFKFLSRIAAMMDKMGGKQQQVGGISQSWTDIFQDAKEILFREIDYRDEATNGERILNDFGLNIGGTAAAAKTNDYYSGDGKNNYYNKPKTSLDGKPLSSAHDWIRIPYVYTNISSEKLLVMEYVPSIKITNTQQLQDANVTMEEKEYLADMLARAYLRQFCCNLFFSTDPHPGNLGVEILYNSSSTATTTTTKKPRVRLVMYDFGQAASLTRSQANGILDIIEAIIDMDVDKSVVAFEKMGVLKENADLELVRAKVADNYKKGKIKANQKKLKQKGYYDTTTTTSTASETQNTTTTNATNDLAQEETSKRAENNVNDAQVMSFFTLPTEYAFVFRALSQMDGVGKSLDPDFDFISSAAPYLVEIKGAGKYVRDELSKWWSNLWKM